MILRLLIAGLLATGIGCTSSITKQRVDEQTDKADTSGPGVSEEAATDVEDDGELTDATDDVQSKPAESPLKAFTWHEPPKETDHLIHFSGVSAHNPSEIDYELGLKEGKNKLKERPRGYRALFPHQASFYLAKDGWNPGRENYNDRTIATELNEDIEGEERTTISVDKLPYKLEDGHELAIQTADPQDVPLGKKEGIILAYVDGGVQKGATEIPIRDKNGNPVEISSAAKEDYILSNHQSLWPIHATAELQASMEEYIQGVVDSGATIDAVIFDLETGIGEDIAHKHDPRWTDPDYGFDGKSMKAYFEDESGFTLQEAIDSGGRQPASLAWSALVSKRVLAEAVKEAFFEPVWDHFPNAQGSGYEFTGLTRKEAKRWAPQTDGHRQYSPHTMGTHGSKPLYASFRNLTRKALGDLPYRIGNSPFATVLWQTNYARAMYRSTDGKIQPWLAYPNLTDSFYNNDTGSGPYYDEFLRHVMLANDDVPILYWNARDGGGGGASKDNDRRVDEIIDEINQLTQGGYELESTEPIPWATDYKSLVVTEVRTRADKNLYRITVPRLPNQETPSKSWEQQKLEVTVLKNGEQFDTASIKAGEVGTWYRGPADLEFDFEHPPIENVLGEEYLDLTSDVWKYKGDKSPVIPDLEAPDGSQTAFKHDGGLLYADVQLEGNELYTLSNWRKRLENNSTIHVFDARNPDNRLVYGHWLTEDRGWERIRQTFRTPEHGEIRIKMDINPYADLGFWRPMINRGEIHGPYVAPNEL